VERAGTPVRIITSDDETTGIEGTVNPRNELREQLNKKDTAALKGDSVLFGF
jgi:hypothetical protein